MHERGCGARASVLAWAAMTALPDDLDLKLFSPGHDRARQAPPPHLVHAGDLHESQPAEAVLDRTIGAGTRHGRNPGPGVGPAGGVYAVRLASFMRAALPFRSRRK